MKKFLIALALALISTGAFAQQSIFNATYPLAKYQPGFRTINGSQLNSMVDEVNILTGKGTISQVGPVPQSNTFLQVVNPADSANTRAEIDAFGGIPLFTFRRADGTRAAPTAVQSGDEIGSLNAWGYGTTSYGTTGSARMSFFTTENWSDTAHGSKIVWSVTPSTTLTLTDSLTLNNNGTLVGIGGFTSTSPTLGIGYAVGAGGAVTQATNRTTGVTLNTLTGAITTNNASLAAETSAAFTVTDSAVAATDVVLTSIKSGSNGGNTTVTVTTVAAGSFQITVANQNASGGAAETGAIIINYVVIKGSAT